MENLKPINIDNQINNVLFGVSQDEQKKVIDKINFVIQNKDNILKINGKKVFNIEIDKEYILYNLKNRTDGKTIYYYPIQYANIELKSNI